MSDDLGKQENLAALGGQSTAPDLMKAAVDVLQYGYIRAEEGHDGDLDFVDDLRTRGFRNDSEISDEDVLHMDEEQRAIYQVIGIVMDTLENSDVLNANIMSALQNYHDRHNPDAKREVNAPL